MKAIQMKHCFHHQSTNAARSLHADKERDSPDLVVANRLQALAYYLNFCLLQDDSIRNDSLQQCLVSTLLSPCFDHTTGCSCTPQKWHPK